MAMAMPETESVAASSSRMPEGTIDPAIGTEIRDHLSREPAGAGHHVALAQAALQAGRPERAKAPLLRALAILPHEASLHANLAILSPAAPARRAMKRAVALAPDVFPFHANLAAMAIFPAERRVLHGRRALAILPGDLGATLNLALALAEAAKTGEAIASLGAAVRFHPSAVDLRFTLGGLLADVGHTGRAWQELKRAAALAPGDAGVWLRLGRIASSAADPLSASTSVARATTIDPWRPTAWSARLMVSLYDHRTTPAQELGFARARRRAERRPVGSRPSSRRKDVIRVGYLSADYWRHPVAFNLAPAIEAHDRSRFQIACYADVVRRDDMTRRMSKLADRWIEVTGDDDETLARRIRADEIDILVVLAGNTAHNRIGVASLRPSPVQLSLFDVASSGSPEIDAIVVDPLLCPPSIQSSLAERPLQVSCLFCFSEPADAPPTDLRRPREETVLGSFGNPAKLGPATIALWAPLLRALPRARLLLKYKNLYDDRGLQTRIRQAFVAAGASDAAIDFVSRVDDSSVHLDAYRDVDIALDPIPFNGCSATFEALWMGVPVLSRTSGHMMGRMGASILTAAGLGDLVTDDDDAFVTKGLQLAAAHERRQTLRQDLRSRLRASRLVDGRAFARELEGVFEIAHRAHLSA